MKMRIKRIWHGWTSTENADKYQNLLHNEVIPGIEATTSDNRVATQ